MSFANQAVHFVILAGGSGTRLWPISTKKSPKHLVPFIGKKSLLQQTIARILPIANSFKNIWVITNQEQHIQIREHVDEQVNIVVEPVARNTAPAVLLTCHKIRAIASDAIIVILPSDHFIPDQQQFLLKISDACCWLSDFDKIVTLGIKPTFPATGYGYIQAGKSMANNFYAVEKFHEKPDLHSATMYIKQKNMFWNGGIFIGRVRVFIDEFQINATALFAQMEIFIKGGCGYEDLENISIDYAIMEKSKNIVVSPANFEWSDVGNLTTFISLQQKYQPDKENVVTFGGKNNLVWSDKKLIVCIGVSDLCIVETENIILISEQAAVESVKQALPQIQKRYEKNENL